MPVLVIDVAIIANKRVSIF